MRTKWSGEAGDPIRRPLWSIAILAALVAGFVPWFAITYGGSGVTFPRMAEPTPPIQAEIVAVLPEPPGNIAVSADGRIFFTYHAKGRPDIKVLELVEPRRDCRRRLVMSHAAISMLSAAA